MGDSPIREVAISARSKKQKAFSGLDGTVRDSNSALFRCLDGVLDLPTLNCLSITALANFARKQRPPVTAVLRPLIGFFSSVNRQNVPVNSPAMYDNIIDISAEIFIFKADTPLGFFVRHNLRLLS